MHTTPLVKIHILLHWQMRKARVALWWKGNLLTTKRKDGWKEEKKTGEITPLSFPNLCVLCFESDFKATWGWKSPCSVGGKLLLSLLVILQCTAHLLEQDRNANQVAFCFLVCNCENKLAGVQTSVNTYKHWVYGEYDLTCMLAAACM